MGPFEYLLTFVSVILGLAVSDLAVSLHRLLDAGRRVKWDWLAPMAAAVAFLKIVTQWWTWFGVGGMARGITFEMFLTALAGSVLLFLIAAAALPDECPEGPIDLRAHYARVSPRFWILFTVHWLIINAVSIWVQVGVGHSRLDLMSPVYLLTLLEASLIFLRNRWWHTATMALLIVIYIGQFYGHSLGR